MATIYVLQKLKVGDFHCLLKTLKYKYCAKFGHVQNKSKTYRPSIHNLNVIIVSFPDQKKSARKNRSWLDLSSYKS